MINIESDELGQVVHCGIVKNTDAPSYLQFIARTGCSWSLVERKSMVIESKIIFLGTAGDMMVAGKQLLASGGIIVQYDGMQLHLNPGPGALVRCRQFNINPRETDVILVSRNTTLHANDVNAVIDAMTNDGLDKKGVVVSTPQAIDGDATRHGLLQPSSQQHVERIIQLKVADKVALNNIEITPTPTEFDDEAGVGFLVSTPKYLLSYVGDSRYVRRVAKAHDVADIVILNVPFLQQKGDESGMTIDDAIKFLKDVRPILAIISGFGMKMIEADVLEQIRRIQHETKVQTIAAKDGLIVNPLSFTTTITQKKLFTERSEAI